ncbi:hypothetical protein METBIDRAFT_83176 [Metschnikowia bicuspidata var. bicuspidata NRRL YB-4993]|uniref:Uncharacterized protein n=1 Tax=Metschnikowia bicuspidata var. bicuspidata NRRL YB-4993 TaxID=869754 RepID=A0A1A0HBU0_9ASCO|nr:hypothetical protein METBIDRAFT_83176 [Metschnikowia bicuspidata var. bicuspidata NRRL YB-4993]OBA21604.1 hypothetical protein METBIDRAFT_83176 [Metschnikowia bicuspidata var. bicuspidata NRRL YB-4993]
MHTPAFWAVVVPAVSVFFLLGLASVAVAVPKFDASGQYVCVVFGCQFLVMFFRIACVVRKAIRQSSRLKTKLPERAAAGMGDKFLVHLMEESLKFLVVAAAAVFLANERASVASYALVVAGVFACNKIVATLVTFSPVGYEQRFGNFTRSREIFEARLGRAGDKASVGSEGACHVSDNGTLVLQSSGEVAQPPFKLDLFASKSEPPNMPIPGSTDYALAHLRMIDRLYSVSPKDTMYYTYEHFLGSPDDGWAGPADDAPVQGSANEPLCYAVAAGLASEEKQSGVISAGGLDSENASGDTAGAFPVKESAPHLLRPATLATAPCVMAHPALQNSWWAWLFPWCNEEDGEKSAVCERALLRKKLSVYSFNSNVSACDKQASCSAECEASSLRLRWSQALYGAADLESQCLGRRVPNSQTFYEYARFANNYLDFWSPSVHGVMRCMDPAFVRFGVAIPDLPAFYFICYSAGVFMWQVSSTLVLAMPFLGRHGPWWLVALALATLVVAKLFSVNFLHGQCTSSYKVSIFAELGLNALLYGLAYVWFYLSVWSW